MSSDSVHSNGSKVLSISTDEGHAQNVSKIKTAGDGDEFIVIGNQKFYRHELMSAFGGTLNPGLAPPPKHQFANPAPLGLSAFALTTFVLSMFNAQAMGITTPNIVVSLAAFYGGAVQFLAGVWELAIGNTFGGTALTSYGAFWLSYAAINIQSFGIIKAYADTDQLANAVGFFLLAWAIFTFILTLCTLKSTAAFCALFSCLTITFILLAAGEFTGKVGVARAGGVVGVITGFLGFYNAFAGVANPTNSYFTAWPIPLTKQH
ncbi:GPR1/FUN34/yaaH family-domain-containing protein [Scheffersomyces xylosifermentans]|uniref:GPR1/FUN34/yaaH family-domain-containing protein n=1 Tax=Scheffersomyces xylosifermentans TaxID=1304137 RepID=UPI00315CB022